MSISASAVRVGRSRRDARVDERGELVLLEDQDRSLWHGEEIEEGGLGRTDEAARRLGELRSG